MSRRRDTVTPLIKCFVSLVFFPLQQINFIFLFNIVRILMTKLRASTTSETIQYRYTERKIKKSNLFQILLHVHTLNYSCFILGSVECVEGGQKGLNIKSYSCYLPAILKVRCAFLTCFCSSFSSFTGKRWRLRWYFFLSWESPTCCSLWIRGKMRSLRLSSYISTRFWYPSRYDLSREQ